MIEFFHLVERVSSTERWWDWRGIRRYIYRSLFDESAGNSLESLLTEGYVRVFQGGLCHFANSVDRRTVTTLILFDNHIVTSGTTLQNGVRERVVSKDCTLMYHPVWRFTCIQYPVIFFQITGLGFSFLVFKSLLSSLLVFSPFWGSRHFLNSVTCNQRARTGTHDYFPQWNVDPQRIFWCLELSDSIDNQSSFHSLAVFRLYFFSIFTGVSFWIFLRFFTVFQKLRLVYAC